MQRQPVPTVTDADVERIVDRDFPPAERAVALEALSTYGTETWEREACRVRLAILKLAAGDLDRLRSSLTLAKADYRDALLAAEYPTSGKRASASRSLSPAEQARITESDWRQYQEWLSRT